MEESNSEGHKVLRGRYELGSLLGHGTFAKVYLAKNLKTNANVAIKVIAKEKIIKIGMTEHIKREISVMKMVNHPNIVELHEIMATKSTIYFVMELVRGGELFTRIARKGRLHESSARRYFQQLISAVDFCHSRGVYHRDLKPENLLLNDDGNLKVADFGLAAFAEHVRPDGLLHTTCGTPAYVAPEVISKRGYDGAKADIWSCGVILFVLLAGFLPFQDDSVISMYKKIQRGDFKCPPCISPEAKRLITRLLDPNPKSRISIAKVVQSSWYRRSKQSDGLHQQTPLPKEVDELPGTINAFHLISLSQGLDLSPLFGDKNSKHGSSSIRFTTREPTRGVISRLEGIVARNGEKFKVTKNSGAKVRIEGGEKGKFLLAVEAEMFAVSPEVLVVEVKMDGGDTSEYRRFCHEEIRPAIRDIVWTSDDSCATIA